MRSLIFIPFALHCVLKNQFLRSSRVGCPKNEENLKEVQRTELRRGMKGEKSLKDLEIIVGEENFVFVAVHSL